MKLLLHGDNQVQSRQHLSQLITSLKSKGAEIVRLDGLKLSLEDLIQATESQSLFGQTKAVVIERLFANPSKNLLKHSCSQLSGDLPSSHHYFIWENKRLTPSQIKKVSRFDSKEFKAPALIFKLLDSLPSSPPAQVLHLYRQALSQSSSELIHYLLVQRVRDLLTLDLNRRLAPWQKQRLSNQRQAFSQKVLLSLHQKLLELDYKYKTGQLALDLSSELELLLISL